MSDCLYVKKHGRCAEACIRNGVLEDCDHPGKRDRRFILSDLWFDLCMGIGLIGFILFLLTL